jgi:hypothetical protein
MIGLQKEWENNSQETNKHNKNNQSWNRCSHNGTESGGHALSMDTQVERIETVTQQKRMDEVQEKKATSSHCSEEMQQTELTPKVGINNETTNKLHRQQTQECIQAAEMCVETEQKKGRKMEKLNEDSLPLTSIVTRDDRKLFVSNEVTPSSSAMHRLDDTSAFEYTNQEDTFANCHQGNGVSVTS